MEARAGGRRRGGGDLGRGAVGRAIGAFDIAGATVGYVSAGRPADPTTTGPGALRAVVRSGRPAPGGGRFDRFDVASQPIVAPVNARGQVAFYATVLRAPAREGIFLAEAGRLSKVAALGDPTPGGGTLAEFAAHPLPALNAAGHVAFSAQIAGGRATEGVFLGQRRRTSGHRAGR